MNVEIDNTQLELLFPAYLIVDAGGSIILLGPSLSQQLPKLRSGAIFHESFRSISGDDIASYANLARDRKSLQVTDCDNTVLLSGAIVCVGNHYLMAFRHIPAQFSLGVSGLKMSDFGADDPIVPSLLLVGLQKSMIEETRQIALDLSHERHKSVELSERISRVSGYMAHDFNNILSIIRLNAERITGNNALSHQTRRLGEMICETAERGSEITNSLMALSHQKQDSRVNVEIGALINENTSFFKSVAGSKIRLSMELNSGRINVNVSKAGLINCIVNLIINARDAQPKGGDIKITTHLNSISCYSDRQGSVQCESYLALSVSDTGCGMSQEILERAFEPLYSTKRQGNGMGLASIQEFVSEMGGSVCLESSLGEGATCHIYLPAVAQSDEHADYANSTSKLNVSIPGEQRSRVILVEDEPFALEALAEIVETAGYEVTPCGNATAARAALAVEKFCLLLSDIVLPDDSGVLLASDACSHDPDLRVILMSGYAPDSEFIADNWRFIRKPINSQVLIELMRDAMAECI